MTQSKNAHARVRPLAFLPFALLVALAGCSGGGGSSGGFGSKVFQLDSCSLGCTQNACSISEIAPNQPIILTFSQEVDPSTVNSSTISFRTASGAEPVGIYLVNRNIVTFSPQVLISGGATFFGFQTNQTYTMTLRAGNVAEALRSTSGDALGADLVCTLRVTKKVVDLDGNPPRGTLTAPTVSANVKRTTDIIVEFSELVDELPFSAPASEQPVRVLLSRTRLENGKYVCDPLAQRTQIIGSWRVVHDEASSRTICRFLNPVELPGNICVAVEVTSRIKDLAGTPAEPQTFLFVTEPSQLEERTIEESFNNDLQLDRTSSGGDWKDGAAGPALLGGDGLHGDFDYRHGLEIQKDQLYEWRTDDQTIPASSTLSGKAERITDGVFRFSSFTLPRGVTIRFVGSRPPQIFVRGFMDLQGKLDLSAANLPEHDGALPSGQAAGNAAPGGARGGKGGDKPSGFGADPRFSGSPGQDLALPAGHGYAAQAVGTGGKGSPMFPTSGLNADVTYGWSDFFSVQISAGGGGGGFLAAGTDGKAVKTYQNRTQDLGPDGPGGKAFVDLLDTVTNPIPPGKSSLEHFLVGGSGGGGGGGHPYFSFKSTPPNPTWRSSSGGTGGGGAIAARVGWNLAAGTGSEIGVRGGSGFASESLTKLPGPGGAGSGGSILLQVGGTPILNGLLDARGGTGGSLTYASYDLETRGGNGSHGLLRLEVTGTPDKSLIGTTMPAAVPKMVAALAATERDRMTGQRSRWYSTNVVFPPEWVRYEIQAEINDVPIVFSDDPSKGRLAAEGEAVQFLVQGANLDETGQPKPNEIGGWRRYVGSFTTSELSLHSDGRISFRFLLLYDRTVASKIKINHVKVVYRT